MSLSCRPRVSRQFHLACMGRDISGGMESANARASKRRRSPDPKPAGFSDIAPAIRKERQMRICSSSKARAAAEGLEHRVLMSSSIESIDGTGNNLAHTTWGSTGTDLLRKAPAAYADGISSPGGKGRPSARVISNLIDAEPTGTATNN